MGIEAHGGAPVLRRLDEIGSGEEAPVGGEDEGLAPPSHPSPAAPPLLPPSLPSPPLLPGSLLLSSEEQLRAALAAASDGEPHILVLPPNEMELAGAPLLVPAAAKVTLDAAGATLSAAGLSRLFEVKGRLVLRGARLTGGRADSGNGTLSDDRYLLTADDGGSIVVHQGGACILEACTIEASSARRVSLPLPLPSSTPVVPPARQAWTPAPLVHAPSAHSAPITCPLLRTLVPFGSAALLR